MIPWMVKVCISGQMDAYFTVNLYLVEKTAEVFFIGQLAKFMMVDSKMISVRVVELFIIQTAKYL